MRQRARAVDGAGARAMAVGSALWLALLLSALGAPTAQASEPLALLRAHFATRGASAVHELAKDFVFEGEALARSLALSERGCVAVLAWGGTGVRDVDVGLYSRGGQVLAEDRSAAPFGYARLCGAAGLSLFVSARAYAGRGELTLFLIEGAPRELGRLPSALPTEVSPGGLSPELRAIGGQEATLSFEAALLHDERALVLAGYAAKGAASVLPVRAGLAQGTLILRGNRCFKVVAFIPGARGMMLEVVGDALQRDTKSPEAELLHLAVCTDVDGAYMVRVRTRAMRSVALVRLFEHPQAQREDAVRYGEERALLLAEARTLALERGLSLSHLGEVWLERGVPLTWPFALPTGDCQMLVALPERGVEVELRLVNDDGVVPAENEGRRGPTTLFSCSQRGDSLRVSLQGRGASGSVSLLRAGTAQ